MLSLSRIDISTRPNSHVPGRLTSVPCENAGERVLIHEILFLRPLHRGHGPDVLFLIFGQYQVIAPAPLSSSLSWAFPFLVGTATGGFGDRVDVAFVVPLHVRLEVQFDLALVVCRATDSSQRRPSATRAKLFGHVLGRREAGVAPQDELFHLGDSLAGLGRQKVQIHL